MTPTLISLIPLVLFLAVAVGASIFVRSRTSHEAGGLHDQNERSKKASGFIRNYFIGNRGLGGFVLAMTTVAT